MIRDVIYARVSSDKQDVDLSISAQLKALRERSARDENVLLYEFTDEAESGKTSDRPQFRKMIAMARQEPKPFDRILIWKFSRFARNREDSIVYKALLRKKGIQVVSINEPVEDTATGRLMEAIIECMDEFYSSNLGDEVTRGMRESASRGFHVGSHTPYGYQRIKVNDGGKERPKLEIEPDKARTIKRVFDEMSAGKGLTEIVKELNGEGICGPKGRGWSKTTIHKILTNEAYAGVLVWGKTSVRNLEPVRVEDAWPAIIDKDIFEKAQAMLKSRAFVNMHPQRSASQYLLSGLAKCGYCGRALVGQDAKGGKFHYYVCGTLLKKGSGACKSHYINSGKFERLIIDKIKEQILTEENLRELVRLVNEEMDASFACSKDQLDAVLKEVAEVGRRLDRLYDAIETGKVNLDDLAPRIKLLKDQKAKLESQKWDLEWQMKSRKVELADPETVTSYVNDLRTVLSESSMAERKSFIKSFVKEVIVTGNRAELKYTIPLSKDGPLAEDLEVPHIVRFGGAEGSRTPDLLTAS
jgi:DNA invertase Pin-like site-specific DNA recombinase